MKERYVHRLRSLRGLRKRNNQKGFTLIELLVVISILGILAAVVTMSMVGVTKLAQDRAQQAELKTVQLALDTMANEQLVPEDAVCPSASPPAGPTHDMSQFPTSATVVPSPTASGQLGTPAGQAIALYPRYLRQHDTHGTYTCANGVVTSVTFNP